MCDNLRQSHDTISNNWRLNIFLMLLFTVAPSGTALPLVKVTPTMHREFCLFWGTHQQVSDNINVSFWSRANIYFIGQLKLRLVLILRNLVSVLGNIPVVMILLKKACLKKTNYSTFLLKRTIGIKTVLQRVWYMFLTYFCKMYFQRL